MTHAWVASRGQQRPGWTFCGLAKPLTPHTSALKASGRQAGGTVQIIKERDRDTNDPGEGSVAPPGLGVSTMDGRPSEIGLWPAGSAHAQLACEVVTVRQLFSTGHCSHWPFIYP